MGQTTKFLGILSAFLFFGGTQSQFIQQPQFPPVPCPQSFRYGINGSGIPYGMAVVPRMMYNPQGIYEFEINMTVNAAVYQNDGLKIRVLSSQQEILNGGPIKYAVFFPASARGLIPWLTQLQFNGQVFCRGMSPPLQEGQVQSAMWAKSTLTTNNGFQFTTRNPWEIGNGFDLNTNPPYTYPPFYPPTTPYPWETPRYPNQHYYPNQYYDPLGGFGDMNGGQGIVNVVGDGRHNLVPYR